MVNKGAEIPTNAIAEFVRGFTREQLNVIIPNMTQATEELLIETLTEELSRIPRVAIPLPTYYCDQNISVIDLVQSFDDKQLVRTATLMSESKGIFKQYLLMELVHGALSLIEQGKADNKTRIEMLSLLTPLEILLHTWGQCRSGCPWRKSRS